MRMGWLSAPMLGAALLCAAQMAAQEPTAVQGDVLEARIWLDRGVDPVLRRGDQVRVYYRASRDAFVSIFHIDTNGFARLLHPGSPTDDHFVLGGRDYRVLFPESRYWHVDEDEGKGYLFIVASPEPLDFSNFTYSRRRGGWDITAMAQTGYRDPFLVMDDVVAALIPQWWAEDYALDFHAYDVDQPHDYPRFLCYDCHGFIPIFDWNPYDYWCTDFRVVIHDDPYYYPVYRYRGDRVVYTRPVARLRPMFDFKERAGDEPATPLIRSRTPTRPRLPARDVDVGAGAPRATPEGRDAPAVRLPRPDEPLWPSAMRQPGEGATASPEAEPAGGRVPPVATDPSGAAGRRVPVERVDPRVRPNPAGGSAAGPPLPDPLPRGARERSVQEVPAGTRSAEGREERPVLRRRPEPPAAGSTQPPAARPRTPSSGPPPPTRRPLPRPPVPFS